MLHSDKVLAQQIFQYLKAFEVKNIVISPGSRNAPLIIESNIYTQFNRYSIVDERSAAFFGLGIALAQSHPVALVCTSGSALLNYYPAIAEAFYASIPLLVITADRPKHLIDIGDGQTIRQKDVFKSHVALSINLSEENPEQNAALLQSAFEILIEKSAPVHINVPFSEPLYNTTDNFFSDSIKINSGKKDNLLPKDKTAHLAKIWNSSSKKMIIVGLSKPDALLQKQLENFSQDPSVIILTETTSNVFHQSFINHIDRLIFPFTDDDFSEFQPEILMTIGGQVVSKKIKSLLRKNKPQHHWHIDKYWKLDTYNALTEYVECHPQAFFTEFYPFTKPIFNSSYHNDFLQLDRLRNQKHQLFFEKIPYSDLKVYHIINQHFTEAVSLVFSNSAAIRYAQFFDWQMAYFISCNRGTSGIDGSTSTAIGLATQFSTSTLLITGDLSFFYDSNALWNNYIPKNFKIIIINNSGGGIFRFIPGPTTTHTLDFFETPHRLNAQHLSEMYGFEYTKVNDEWGLLNFLPQFFKEKNKPQILEIFTPQETNAVILKDYFNFL